jgi:hypothetical protein
MPPISNLTDATFFSLALCLSHTSHVYPLSSQSGINVKVFH